jgi:AcrR family transcriptional regulator
MAGSADDMTPRRREIVAAARRLLEERGPEALSMRNLAAELGIRASSLYKHVRGKEDLETALMAAGLAELGDAFEEAVDGADDPLAALAAAYRRWALAHRHLYLLSTGRPLRRDLLAPGVEERPAGVVVRACGGDADAARAAFAFAHGMVTLEIAGRFPPGADLDAAWAAGIEGLRRRPRARRGAVRSGPRPPRS